MTRKILCPKHQEATPSCVLYPDGWAHCFGCGARFKHADTEVISRAQEDPEDLTPAFEYIEDLPRREIRGLSLPADDRGFFIVWPDRAFYKKRLYSGKPKYIGPRGHQPPLFVAGTAAPDAPLVIVEGELNALSVARACPELNVVSPGSASNFCGAECKSHLKTWYNCGTILIICDEDRAGAEACIGLMAQLGARGKRAYGHLMPKDANALLVGGGCEAVKAEISNILAKAVAALS